MIDPVKLLRDKAELKGWKTVYGAKQFHSFELSAFELAPNEEVLLIFPCMVSPQVENGFWSRYRVTTQLWLCRKWEDDSTSSVAETEAEKYDARLLDLSIQMDKYLKELFSCTHGVEILSVRYSRELNQLSQSVDGVTADITFNLWE